MTKPNDLIYAVETTLGGPVTPTPRLNDYEQFRDKETGLYRFPVPESETEELARLREENARLRAALIEERQRWVDHFGESTYVAARPIAIAQLIAEGLLPPE